MNKPNWIGITNATVRLLGRGPRALPVLRETSAMGALPAVHPGFVLALYAALPYGKMAHGVCRFLALAQNAAERKPLY